jgi:ATP-dependent Clp protease ATP-binding subunit ClpC
MDMFTSGLPPCAAPPATPLACHIISPPGLTPRARTVIELALLEQQTDNHPFLTTGHLLIGLVVEPEGIAGRVLEEFGVHLAAARREVRRAMEAVAEEK